jgi:hypothetical protein
MSSGEIGLAVLCAEHDMAEELLMSSCHGVGPRCIALSGLGKQICDLSTGALRHPAVVVSTLRAGGAFYLLRSEAVILLGGIGFQPVRNTGKMTGWKPIPRFFHNLSGKISCGNAREITSLIVPGFAAISPRNTAKRGSYFVSVATNFITPPPGRVLDGFRSPDRKWYSTRGLIGAHLIRRSVVLRA